MHRQFYEDRVRDSQYFKIHRLLSASRSMAVRTISVACLVVILISCGGAVIRLEDVCRVEEGRCDWRGEGVYRGCIDSQVVTFNYFGVGGVLDLRCSNVGVMEFEDTDVNMRCRDILLFGDVPITVYFGDQTCVSSSSIKIYIILSRYIDSF